MANHPHLTPSDGLKTYVVLDKGDYPALEKVAPAGADSCTPESNTDAAGRRIRFKKVFQKASQCVRGVKKAEERLRCTKEKLHK